MESEPALSDIPLPCFFPLFVLVFSAGTAFSLLLLLCLLFCSAFISGSEVAYFSLTSQNLSDLKTENSPSGRRIIYLRSIPRRLLATILISNNFVNIAIVILAEYIVWNTIPADTFGLWGASLHRLPVLSSLTTVDELTRAVSFLITVFGVTFLLVLFGEVAPKIYAKMNNIRLARWMSLPLQLLVSLFSPLSSLLVRWSSGLERRFRSGMAGQANKDDIDKAIDLAVSQDDDSKIEADILKSIIKFNDVSVKQVMRARVDVVAVDETVDFDELLATVRDSGYSRIPVYQESFDHITGILYVKDLIGHRKENGAFAWQGLVRNQVLYVPESKKINDLLKDFQRERVHMAIVVDEYGGSAGLVTLEDVMEEVIGEIKDEFDDAREGEYKEIDPRTFVFDGKVLINEACRAMGIETSRLEGARRDADSLAGLLLELNGEMPVKGQEFVLDGLQFIVLSVSKKRIEKIRIHLSDES